MRLRPAPRHTELAPSPKPAVPVSPRRIVVTILLHGVLAVFAGWVFYFAWLA